MRLTKTERRIITKAIKKYDPDAQILLFGSRTNDDLKGGDIDILVISEKINYPEKLAIRRQLFKYLEDQKIDIVVSPDTSKYFIKDILSNALPI